MKANYENFTFQYVSINTYILVFFQVCEYTLHSNMFLLIQFTDRTMKNAYLPLHSNMFLLIPFLALLPFQYICPLHSNMFLLIPRSSEPPINSSILYHILSTMVFFYLFIYFDITRFTGSTILLMFFTFVDLS